MFAVVITSSSGRLVYFKVFDFDYQAFSCAGQFQEKYGDEASVKVVEFFENSDTIKKEYKFMK